eukprot:7416005-Pyramimonas_sp.AAC.1
MGVRALTCCGKPRQLLLSGEPGRAWLPRPFSRRWDRRALTRACSCHGNSPVGSAPGPDPLVDGG